MYKVVKKDGKVLVVDTFTEKTIYASPEDGYIVYKAETVGLQVVKVGDLTDIQLLTALANCVKLPIDR